LTIFAIVQNFNFMSLKRFGVSLEEDVLDALDQFVKDNGFANRSQAIRFLVEKNVAERKWQCGNIVAGTVIIMYNQSKREIALRITEIQQQYQDVILSSSQYYLNEDFCLHLATVTGVAHRLTELSDKLITIKGIKHGKLVMSRAD
jgi:CopG family nickel-responsive transcriptional regulator